MGLPATVRTEAQPSLSALASQLTEPHRACALPKEGAPRSSQCPPTAELPAGHCGITQVPSVVTHGAPTAAIPDLQSAGTAVWTISQAQPLWGWRRGVVPAGGPGEARDQVTAGLGLSSRVRQDTNTLGQTSGCSQGTVHRCGPEGLGTVVQVPEEQGQPRARQGSRMRPGVAGGENRDTYPLPGSPPVLLQRR